MAMLGAELQSGRTTSVELTKRAFDAIDAAGGNGNAAFLRLHRDTAMARARCSPFLESGARITPRPPPPWRFGGGGEMIRVSQGLSTTPRRAKIGWEVAQKKTVYGS